MDGLYRVFHVFFLCSMFYDLCLLTWIYLDWVCTLHTHTAFGLLRLVVWLFMLGVQENDMR